MQEAIVAIQIPYQGRRIIFAHLTMEDFVTAVMNQYAALDTDDEAVNELMDSDPRDITLEMCRAALAHDMSHVQVLTMSEAVDRIHQNGDFAEEIAAELEDWGWVSERQYMHPQSGSVQSMADWVDDSEEWEGDIKAQLATLLPVVIDTDGNYTEYTL
jgi:hypothetical protein